MEKKYLAMMIAPLALALSGCATIEGRVYGECDNTGKCKAGGEVKGTIQFKSYPSQSLLEAVLASGQAFDAAQFRLDVSQSTVTVPAYGTVVVSLVDSSTNAVTTSSRFSWTRVGNELVLSDPNAVNTWAYANGGTADSVRYALDPFNVALNPGERTFAIASEYEGTTVAASSYTWQPTYGGGCREVACQEQ